MRLSWLSYGWFALGVLLGCVLAAWAQEGAPHILGAQRVPRDRIARFSVGAVPAGSSVEWDVYPKGAAQVEERGPSCMVVAPPGRYELWVRVQRIDSGKILTQRASVPLTVEDTAPTVVQASPQASEVTSPVVLGPTSSGGCYGAAPAVQAAPPPAPLRYVPAAAPAVQYVAPAAPAIQYVAPAPAPSYQVIPAAAPTAPLTLVQLAASPAPYALAPATTGGCIGGSPAATTASPGSLRIQHDSAGAAAQRRGLLGALRGGATQSAPRTRVDFRWP